MISDTSGNPDLRIDRAHSLKRVQSGWDFGLICLVVFIVNLHVSFSALFPILRPLRLQLIAGVLALIGFLISSSASGVLASWSAAQSWYAFYLLTAIVSLQQTAAVGLWDIGSESVATMAKQFGLLCVIVGYSSTVVGFQRVWLGFVVAVSALELHSLKAITTGQALVQGRFVSYVGLVANSDYIGLFFVMVTFITAELARGEDTSTRSNTLIRPRIIYLVLCLGASLIAVMTQTRSAFLALTVVGALWVWRTKDHMMRIKLLAIVLVIMVGVSFTVQTPHGTYFDRIQSIWADDEGEDFSQKSRKHLWSEGWRIWGQFPFLGCGTGATGPYMDLMVEDVQLGNERKGFSLHQTFLQVAAERGTLGLVTFVGFLYAAFRSLRVAKRAVEGMPIEADWLPILNGLEYTLLAYVVGSFFMSIENEWVVIIVAGLGAGALTAIRTEAKTYQIHERTRGEPVGNLQ